MRRPRHGGRYADRADAGRVLAARLGTVLHREHDVLVLGLPRGGVPVAAEVAQARDAALDVLVVRKLGIPGRPELAMGAVAGLGGALSVVRDADLLARHPVDPDEARAVEEAETAELRRRERAYRRDRPVQVVTGRCVVLVDDGLATGSTMRAAVAAVRAAGPARVVVAAPVGSSAAVRMLGREADAVVCPRTPTPFRAVAQGYAVFDQTPDEQVVAALDAAR